MTYKSEELLRRLRQARTDQGLSQRALAGRSGLTQSHISQIESGSTEPGVSSLIDLARALDLEVMLIPRNRIPAVSGLIATRASEGFPADPAVRRALRRGEAVIAAIAQNTGNTASLDRIREALILFRSNPPDARDLSTVVDVLDGLKRRQEHPEIGRSIREAAETLGSIRNRLAHGRPGRATAAWALDDADEVDG